MGLVALFGRRRYRHRYDAAWATYLAHYTYATLAPADAQRVHELAVEFLRQVDPGYPWITRTNAWRLWAVRHAAAMHALGIPPALDGERWPFTTMDARGLLARAPVVVVGTDWRGTNLVQRMRGLYAGFRHFDPATADVLADLKRRGVDVEPLLPDPLSERRFDASRSGKYVTWRDWWLEQGASAGRR